MYEILTLQLGGYANYVGSHFWNLQVGGGRDVRREICDAPTLLACRGGEFFPSSSPPRGRLPAPCAVVIARNTPDIASQPALPPMAVRRRVGIAPWGGGVLHTDPSTLPRCVEGRWTFPYPASGGLPPAAPRARPAIAAAASRLPATCSPYMYSCRLCAPIPLAASVGCAPSAPTPPWEC